MISDKVQIHVPTDVIGEFCKRWKVTQFALFGSVLREDFRPDSDVDVLVTFAREANRSVFDLIEMEKELRQILQRKVDLVDRRTIEQSENYIRRRHILDSAETVYGT